MNDIEEVRFGVNEGHLIVFNSDEISNACETEERTILFKCSFEHYFTKFVNEHVLDTYVFCLSAHDEDDYDGLLSMWRGYGANGNGAAIVFDTPQIIPVEGSPLIIAEVHYATDEARREWINGRVLQFSEILGKSSIPNDKSYLAAFSIFERIKLFVLSPSNRGFKKEKE